MEWIKDTEDFSHDPEKLSFKIENSIFTESFSKNLLNLFNKNITVDELKLSIRRSLSWNYVNIVSKIDIYLNNRYSQSSRLKSYCYLFVFKNENKILPNFKNNVKVLRFPSLKFGNLIFKFIKFFTNKLNIFKKSKVNIEVNNNNNFKIIHILHHGMQYASWKKDYINFEKSKFKKEEIIYLDYAKNYNYHNLPYLFIQPNFKKIFKNKNLKFIKNLLQLLFHSRSKNQFYSSFLYARIFLETKYYCSLFSDYKNVKIAIIDYEDLCPHSIIFALKKVHIKTIGIQQRFANIFFNYPQINLDFYLVGSHFIKNKLLDNPNINKF